MARASSGSRSSISSIDPLMSANSAVTVLRSPSGGSPATGPFSGKTDTAEAQSPFEVGGVGGVAGTSAMRLFPHLRPNLEAGELVVPQTQPSLSDRGPHVNAETASRTV